MDIQKMLTLGTEFLADYLSVLVLTVTSPVARFQPVAISPQPDDLIVPHGSTRQYLVTKLNPKLFGFVLLSIFIGATLNSVVPNRPSLPEFTTTCIVTMSIWVAYSVAIYVTSILLRGRVIFWETVSVSLQLLSTIYVISNLIAFIWGLITQTFFVQSFDLSGSFFEAFIDFPILIYYLVHVSLMAIYLPIVMRRLHGFGLVRLLIFSIIPIAWVSLSLFAFLNTYVSVQVTPETTLGQQTKAPAIEPGTLIMLPSSREALMAELMRREKELEKREVMITRWRIASGFLVLLLIMLASTALVRKRQTTRAGDG